MKNVFRLSVSFLLISATCIAEFQVGNGAFLLDTSLTGVYDSNLRGAADEMSDFYLSFQPTLRYRRLGSRFKTNASVGVHVNRYLDNPNLNSDDVDGKFDWGMARVDGHTTAADLSLSYLENSDAVLEVNERVRTKTFLARTSGEILVAGTSLFSAGVSLRDSQHSIGSNQTSASGRLGYSFVGFTDGTTVGVDYSRQDSKSKNNTVGATVLDQTSDTGTISVTHPIYADLTGRATYGYRWLDRGRNESLLGLNDDSGAFYSLNLEGPFLPKKFFPKTTGTFHIGYEQADTPGLNDRTSAERLVGQLNLTWAARETTSVRFYASRSQNLSINDNTVVSESTGIYLTQAVGSFVDTNFSVTYTNADFVNLARTDERYEAHAGATYKINRVWSSSLRYNFLHSKSNFSLATFDRHIVTGTVTYAF